MSTYLLFRIGTLAELLIAYRLSLFLNIFTPHNATLESSLPVKAWIHGGGNSADGITNPLYNGCATADDAIVVTINYRLGPLGYLALEQAGLEGNYGIQDQLLALQWIQDNIAAFGGDPTKVLLFGESAGAYDAFTISTLPQAPSLFSAVISESGSGQDLPTFSQVQYHNNRIARAFGCDPADVVCLRRLNTTAMNNTLLENGPKVLTVAVSLLTNENTGISWSPVVDGKTIPDQPRKVGTKVPAIFGTNGNEGAIFFWLLDIPFAGFNETMYDTFIDYNFGPWASSVKAQYSISRFGAKEYPTFAAMSAILTDFYFKCPTYRALKGAVDKNVPVFSYLFNNTPSCSWLPAIPQDRQLLDTLGATHTSDIPFVFAITDNLPPPHGNCSFTQQERGISNFLAKAWTSMASRQSPGTDRVWPAWDRVDSMGLVIDNVPDAGYLDYNVCYFWDVVSLNITELSQTDIPYES